MFYAFALLATMLRLVVTVWSWDASPVFSNIEFVQVAAKLCVGLVQDWITFELAIRIRNSNVVSDISESGKKRLRLARRILFTAITLAFLAYSAIVIVSAHMQENDGFTFNNNWCLIYGVLGFCFLC